MTDVSDDLAAKLQIATNALHEIARANRDEGGCYYTNRINIGIAQRAYLAITGDDWFSAAALKSKEPTR